MHQLSAHNYSGGLVFNKRIKYKAGNLQIKYVNEDEGIMGEGGDDGGRNNCSANEHINIRGKRR